MSFADNEEIHWVNDPWAAVHCTLQGFDLVAARVDSPTRIAWGFTPLEEVRESLSSKFITKQDHHPVRDVRSAYLTIMSMAKRTLDENRARVG